jgi:hypothetical protein
MGKETLQSCTKISAEEPSEFNEVIVNEAIINIIIIF